MIAAKDRIKSSVSVTVSGSDVKPVGAGEPEKTVCVCKIPKLILSNSALGIKIEMEKEAVIGRKTGAYQYIFCTQPYVSGSHARVHYDVISGWMITDLGSSNGTLLGSLRLKPNIAYTITNGIHIQIANIELVAELI